MKKTILFLLAVSFIVISGCAQREEIGTSEGTEDISETNENIPPQQVEIQEASPPVQNTSIQDDTESPPSISSIPQLGTLCSGEEGCSRFCLNNRGRCEAYCQENPGNELCEKVFTEEDSGILEEQIINEYENVERQAQLPVLKNLGVNIGPWNRQTDRAGDLIFTEDILFEDDYIRSEWVFIEFGGTGQRKSDSIGSNIEYWFFVPLGTEVRAPVDGIVQIGFFEHTQDWGINFYPGEEREWIVSFEHVVDLKVKDGDRVQAGDVVAEAAPRIDPDIAMVELAVWKGGRDGIYKFCPFDFLDESLKPEYEEKINRLAKDWEDLIGRDVYEQEDWVAPGCLLHNITEVPPS